MFEPISLSKNQIKLCESTISSNAFYMLVGDALVNSKPFSVVRMGDGERQLMTLAKKNNPHNQATISEQANPDDWMKRMGCYGISNIGLIERLEHAANDCTYFAPSVTGIQLENFNLYNIFRPRNQYVDNFFCNAWTEEMKIQLFKTAKHVLFIHRNTSCADAMQIRAKYALDIKVTYLKLENWEQSEDVIKRGSQIDAPLVLFSAGPASKYIGDRIANSGIPKVSLDVGNAADYWLLSSLKDIPNGRR
jgi:hypothetical protein